MENGISISRRIDMKKPNIYYCEQDYKHEHFWERIGIERNPSGLFEVLKCTQCKKCKRILCEFVRGSI